jgi:arginine transport system permease protein
MTDLSNSWINSFFSYFPIILKGLPTSILLSIVALICAFIISVFFTLILQLKLKGWAGAIKLYITIFTGTPLLIQFFIIYYGPGQFSSLQQLPLLWSIISHPWFCACLALTLNSAAYTTLLFSGTIKAIPAGLWQSCEALGLSRIDSLKIMMTYAFRRALSAYSNEVILIFKSTSLASTITLMDIMGYTQLVYNNSYDLAAFACAGIIYLIINSFLTTVLRIIEAKCLKFEQVS